MRKLSLAAALIWGLVELVALQRSRLADAYHAHFSRN
jgi:hypothetical protein